MKTPRGVFCDPKLSKEIREDIEQSKLDWQRAVNMIRAAGGRFQTDKGHATD